MFFPLDTWHRCGWILLSRALSCAASLSNYDGDRHNSGGMAVRILCLSSVAAGLALTPMQRLPAPSAPVASSARSAPGSIVAQASIESPFAVSQQSGSSDDGPLPLTLENVELVLDGMRPYLLADGGNVAVREIDGATVILELQGACGTCPSSSMTMKMGLERGLLEKIPEIIAVEQIAAEGAAISEELIEEVLDDIRPLLKMVKGDVKLISVDAGDLQPSCTLRVYGENAAMKSIRGEIIQRLRKEMPTLSGVLWEYE